MSDPLIRLLEEMVAQQRARLMEMGRRLVPTLTPEDLLQPNDYPELEFHPLFRYEEGVLEGLQAALAAIRTESMLSSRAGSIT